jgi:hypothetical protein
MFQKIRKSRYSRIIAFGLIILMFIDIINPLTLKALTTGPSQPEVQSFSQASVSDMVDVFTGDFSYNIPLMDVGGYPINISYSGGINMDQEASWVGLGWNINPGVINRNMRAIPDDFKGEKITKEFNIKDNNTYGVAGSVDLELFGIKALKTSLGVNINYNNYKGFGFGYQVEPSISASNANKASCTLGLGLSASSESGVSITPNVSFERKIVDEDYKVVGKQNLGVGVEFNSRSGLKELTMNYNRQQKINDKSYFHSSGGSYSFAGQSYTPEIKMSMVNLSASLNVTLGADFFGTHPDVRVNGFYSTQRLKTNKESQPAYGYYYAQYNKGASKVMLDFNRELDRSFTKHTPNLPVTNFTYDVYTVSGQGLGGSYRPFRSDIGVIYDSENNNITANLALPGIEVGGGNIFHGGINATLNTSNTVSGNWRNDNSVISTLKFKGSEDVNTNYSYEPSYFKQAGEKVPESDPGFYDKIGKNDPVRVKIDKSHKALRSLVLSDKSEIPITEDNIRAKRPPRNQSIQPINALDASRYGLIKDIESFKPNSFNMGSDGNYSDKESISRSGDKRKPYHISEITTYKPDGSKYVFGIPAYNNKQEDVSFSVVGGMPDLSTGLVSYNHGSDNTVGNKKGEDNYFNKTTMPPYSHSFLLTAVLSPDYVDVTDNGPSDDDLGNYTKINYTRLYNNYQWRVPFEENKANYDEGLKTSPNNKANTDDKASYIYGEKEIWYVHSIESKTMVAEFILADREDGFGVKGDEGGIGSQPLKKLVRIDLYAKNDKKKFGDKAVPVKSVHFEYDYSLCKGVPNNTLKDDKDENGKVSGFQNQGGKLTLKKVYFTFQKSNRGKYSPYEFKYGQLWKKDGSALAIINPEYNLKGYDRWGSFKNNPKVYNEATLTNAENPYTNQEKVKTGDLFDSQGIYEAGNDRYIADIYSVSWNLTSIELPSGGTIKVDYEADDYSHVQNLRAMQMFKVIGATSFKPTAANIQSPGELYEGSITNPVSKSYFILELPREYTKSNFKEDFLTDNDGQLIKEISFRFLVNLGAKGEGKYEYVNGWAKLDSGTDAYPKYGMLDKTHAFIKVKEIDINDNVAKSPKANPVSQAAWNFAKLNTPRIAYGQPDPTTNGVKQIFDAMISALKQIVDFAAGYNYMMRLRQKGLQFDKNKSWVRLYTPDAIKKGGGHRVKRIVMNDEWKEIVGNAKYKNEEYGQEYIYTTTNDKNELISSGVASYEPMIGGNENPFKKPISFSEKNLLAPSEDYYLEEPIGESLFPSPVVGYRKVVVQNLQRPNVKSHATGKTVHEFYTSKDFPTIRLQTELDNKHEKSNPVLTILKIDSKDFMTVSQGYVIELNDMHGKPKSVKTYQETGALITGTEYKYKLKEARRGPNASSVLASRLDNMAKVINKDGSVKEAEIGIDYDFIVDNRQQESNNITTGINGNLETFLAAIFPVAVPVVLPKYASERIRFRSITTTKVINRYGLLDEVISYDQGSEVSAKNELYDAETGEVLLTKTINAHNDPVYNFVFPAHWAYNGMGLVYKTLNAVFSSASSELVPGDIVEFDNPTNTGTEKAIGWISNANGTLEIIDKTGQIYKNPGSFKVIRPGRKNMQSTPVATITCLEDPIKFENGIYSIEFNKVLNANAVEYSDEAGVFCKECGIEPGSVYNPFLYGTRNNWKTKINYAYLTDRLQTKVNNNTNIREDGTYSDFSPFWQPNKGNDWERNIYNPKWVFTAQATIYSPFGPELETQDALGRYNSAVYGYGYLLPVATGSNSMYKEVGFDGAEDYEMSKCNDSHFSFEKSIREDSEGKISVSETEAHSGRKSIMVKPSSEGAVRKVLNPCPDTKKEAPCKN